MTSSDYVIEKQLETKINIANFHTLNFKVKPNAKACLFFETKGKDISDTKINVELEENSSCELYGFFKNSKKTTNIVTNVVHKGNQSKPLIFLRIIRLFLQCLTSLLLYGMIRNQNYKVYGKNNSTVHHNSLLT